MSKYCNNCGSEMADDVVFCPNCGAQDAPAYEEAPAANNAPNKKVMILGGIAAAIVAVVALLIILGGGPKRALKRWEKVVNGKGNVEKLIPEDVFKELRKDEDFSKGEFLDSIEDSFEKDMDAVKDEFGDNAKIKYTIVDKKKMNKEDLEDLAEVLDKGYGISEKSVKAAYRMAVKVTTRGKDGKTFHYEQVVVVKIDGKWYTTDIMNYAS